MLRALTGAALSDSGLALQPEALLPGPSRAHSTQGHGPDLPLKAHHRLQEMTIVAHHKTGTWSAFALIGACCCSESKQDAFWSTWGGRCGPACRAQNVTFCHMGLSGDNGDPACSARGVQRKHVVNFVRHPVDVVVSGYLYHRACNEGSAATPTVRWELDKPFGPDHAAAILEVRTLLGASPHAYKTSRSYCQLLQQNSASAGIEAELVRSLASYNGVSGLLRDFTALEDAARETRNTMVHHVCLSSVAPGIDGAPDEWRRIARVLGCNQVDLDVENRTRALHGTSTSSVSESRAELRALAWRAIQRRMSGAEQSAMLALQKLCPVESDELSMISSFRQTRRSGGPTTGRDVDASAARAGPQGLMARQGSLYDVWG